MALGNQVLKNTRIAAVCWDLLLQGLPLVELIVNGRDSDKILFDRKPELCRVESWKAIRSDFVRAGHFPPNAEAVA